MLAGRLRILLRHSLVQGARRLSTGRESYRTATNLPHRGLLLTGGTLTFLIWQTCANLTGEDQIIHCDAGRDFIVDVKRKASDELRTEQSQAKDASESFMPDWSSIGERIANAVLFRGDGGQTIRVVKEQRSKDLQNLDAKSEDASESFLPDWTSLGEKITEAVLPSWAFLLPGYIEKLQREFSGAPGSLVDEIWQEAHDPEINPEILLEANVRISSDLCREEKAFLENRRQYTREALAKYLEIPLWQVHPDDVPTIAICGSGGGLRALVAGTSSFFSAQEAGLFDCVTYTAGVSGSCWLQALFYSSITGQRHDRLLAHLKNRLDVHIAFPPPVLTLLTSAPTDKYLLSGGFEKWRGEEKADFGLVDIYGLLLGARLLVPKGDIGMNVLDLKLSNQRRFVDDGRYPLPIYTAVRHEIPVEEEKKGEVSEAKARERAKQEAWFQWFEFTPYELSCEEITASIPIWAIGRQFYAGRTVFRESGLALPEIRIPLLMGIWGSAFCATLSHYYKELRPVLSGLAGFGGMDALIAGRNDDLVKVHPFDPAQIPNFVLGLRDQLPKSTPENLHNKDSIQLMDAGMSNNLPIYPLLRQGRDVDIIIAFDASADIRKENWLRVADGYALQRGIKGWPVGSGWPDQESSSEATKIDSGVSESSKLPAKKEIEETQDKEQTASKELANEADPQTARDLGYCTIWIGSAEERTSEHPPPSSRRIDDDDFHLTDPSDSGIALVYFPLLPNPLAPGVDPDRSEFLSTWNFVYTPEQIDQVVALARSNFEAGQEKVKALVRAMWQRKKALREESERQRAERWSNLS